jgi:thioredoxin reductase (NADPH)
VFPEVFAVDENQKCDVLIIGAGPAGLTAAIYSAWTGLSTVVLEAAVAGGRAGLAPKIENFPGFPEGIGGGELVDRMKQQAMRFKAEFRSDEEVVGLDLKGEVKKVVSRKQTYEAQTLIIATGTQRRKLQVPGETEFVGRGVSYCAVCDGPFFRKKPVAIVGNGEDAVADALSLAEIAGKVTIFTNGKELDVDSALLSKLQGKSNVEILNAKVIKIIGDLAVSGVQIQKTGENNEATLEVKGVFIALGNVPMTAIVKNAGINTDTGGCLTVDRLQRTNVEGVFAAGDCTCGGMQVVTAAGEGAMAAMRAAAFVRRGLAH